MRPPPRFEEMQAVRPAPGEEAELGWAEALVVAIRWQEAGSNSLSQQPHPARWIYKVQTADSSGALLDLWFPQECLAPASRSV